MVVRNRRGFVLDQSMKRANEQGMSKYQRFRANRARQGMKLLRVWVPDTHVPGFPAEVARQAALLKGAPEEAEALNWIEAAADLDDGA